MESNARTLMGSGREGRDLDIPWQMIPCDMCVVSSLKYGTLASLREDYETSVEVTQRDGL